MKIPNSRIVAIAGGLLAATLIAGCWSGGHGYSSSPYGYNDSSYTASQSNSGYGGAYSYNSGYGEVRPYPQNHGNANSYNAGYHAGVKADDSRDQDRNRAPEARAGATHEQAQAAKPHANVAHNDYSKDDSRSAHDSEKN